MENFRDLHAELLRRQTFGANIHAVVDVVEANGDRCTMSCELEDVGSPEMRTSIDGELDEVRYFYDRYGVKRLKQTITRAILDTPEAPFERPAF